MRNETECSKIEKGMKKVQKTSKKVLTFPVCSDKIKKLAHGALLSAALNLENDTEQETQNYDSNSE